MFSISGKRLCNYLKKKGKNKRHGKQGRQFNNCWCDAAAPIANGNISYP